MCLKLSDNEIVLFRHTISTCIIYYRYVSGHVVNIIYYYKMSLRRTYKKSVLSADACSLEKNITNRSKY